MWTAQRAWQLLGTVALVGCAASLFGPDERWLGVDVGATGSAVFTLAMIGALTLASMRPAEIFPEHWSLAESRAWVALVFILLVLVSFVKYFLMVSNLNPVPATPREFPADALLWQLSTLLVAWGIISAVLAHRGGPDEDERDLRMRLGADRAGDWALTMAIAGCIALLIALPAARLAWWLQPMVVVHLLIGILILRTFVEHIARVILYAIERR
jgi:hypothetical protein